MKVRFTFSIMGLLFAMFILMSNSGGRAVAGFGNTGAPGDAMNNCGMCHQGGNFGTTIEIEVVDSDGTAITEYIPGNVYTVNATVNTTTAPQGYGLQLVSLIDDTEADSEGLANPSANAQISTLNSRNYLEQVTLSSAPLFSAEWTAPASSSGSVTFYASGHAANGNSAASGDQANVGSVTVTEVFASVDNLQDLGLTIAPNPTQDVSIISLDQRINGTIELFDIAGKNLLSTAINSDSYTLDLSDMRTGMYFVKVTDLENNVFESRRVIKN